MKERDRRFSQFIKTGEPHLLTDNKKIRNKLGQEIKEAKKLLLRKKI